VIRQYHIDGSGPEAGQVFVFGSNLSGLHGAGAARAAHQRYGAVLGVGEGPTGQSYALPTVRKNITGPLPLPEIQAAVERFLTYAHHNPELSFLVTRVGCVLAGYSDADIAPMFRDAPMNCSLPETWRPLLAPTAPLLSRLLAFAEAREVTPTNQSLGAL
jgi:hypothetical protein